jgi:hypothetical protein
MRGAKT